MLPPIEFWEKPKFLFRRTKYDLGRLVKRNSKHIHTFILKSKRGLYTIQNKVNVILVNLKESTIFPLKKVQS